MKENICVIYDDRWLPEKKMQNVVGQKRFSEIIYKRKTFFKHTCDILSEIKFINKVIPIYDSDQRDTITDAFHFVDTGIVHMKSNIVIQDKDEFKLILEKLRYANTNIVVNCSGNAHILYFIDMVSYAQYLKMSDFSLTAGYMDELQLNILGCGCLYDVSNYMSFVAFLSSSFNARYFNSLTRTDYAVTKKSSDKLKMKKEYTFYHLLPQDIQSWFVLPYNYQEGQDWASYTMERYNLPDMAIRWIHGSISAQGLDQFLNKSMQFIMSRKQQAADARDCAQIRRSLYFDKVKKRMEMLHHCAEADILNNYIQKGSKYDSINEVMRAYTKLFEYSEKMAHVNYLIIGHGDFCFSNILYDSEIMLMRLIDPQGALTEADLWTDPYYDVAKLSHSVCGLYDFINNGIYQIEIDENLQFRLMVDFDNKEYIEIFQNHIKQNGFDFGLVRLYEASLFLSMLPLHIDNPQKVFGFLLNAIEMIEEVEDRWMI